MVSFSILTVFATFVAATLAQQCYSLDGTALDSTYAPCNPGAKHSGCCATKRTNGPADICLDSGLCMATASEQIGMIWQSGCTDATGKDAACPSMCPSVNNDADGLPSVVAWQIQTCDYGKYCCRAAGDRRSCCNNATASKVTTSSIGALLLDSARPTTDSITGQPAEEVVTAVSTNTTIASHTDTCSKERQKTAVVGGTIGGLFGAIIIGLAGTIYWMYKRERRQRRLKEHYEEQFSQTNAYRKALASTAGSIRGSLYLEELTSKGSGRCGNA